jgi:hypothetical protein
MGGIRTQSPTICFDVLTLVLASVALPTTFNLLRVLPSYSLFAN